MKIKQIYKNLKDIVPVVLVSVLVLLGAFTVVNAQRQDSGGKPALDYKNPLLYEAQGYASNTGVSIEEALRRFQLQDIAGELDAELSMKEVKTFAGLWVEHTPEFRVVVQFTRDGEETIKPYLKQHIELANSVELYMTKAEQMETDMPFLTPTAQASPEAPGFEAILASLGLLTVRRMLMRFQ